MTTALTLTAPGRLADTDRGSYRLETVSTLDAMGDNELHPLTAGRTFYVSRPWLKAVELQRDDRTAYVTCRDGAGILRGVCPVYWDEPGSRGFYDPFGQFLHRSGAEFNQDDWSPPYLIGSRAAYSCEFLVDTTIEPNQQRDVLALLLDAVTTHAREVDAASLSALYLNPRGAAQLRAALADDQPFYIAGANAVLDVPWSSMDEYVNAMGRRSGNIRREMRTFGEQGYTIAEGRLSDWIDVAADLFSRLERRYGHESSAADEAAELRTLAACADDHGHVLAIRDGAEVIGAALVFVWEGVVYTRSAGFNYGATKRAFEYFNLIYEMIRFAIEHGYRRLDMGMATYRAKLARGARLEPLWGMSISRTADSPLCNDTFGSWDQARRAAVRAADPAMLESAELP
ncbi:MAG TPA: GNAT family N-acetyltransferase [Pseudonocardiaceae bacterium]